MQTIIIVLKIKYFLVILCKTVLCNLQRKNEMLMRNDEKMKGLKQFLLNLHFSENNFENINEKFALIT